MNGFWKSLAALAAISVRGVPGETVRAADPSTWPGLPALENGDANGDWQVDLSDAVYLLGWLYGGGPEPAPLDCGLEPAAVQNGDSNGDRSLDVSDPIYLLGYLFSGGPAPASGCGGEAGAGGARNQNPGVLPPGARAYGKTYGEWGAAWWQWVNSVPKAENPLFDETGENCDSGQSGPVWFLAGVLNESHTATRDACVVPAGKSIFFPILNVNAWVPDDGATPDEVRGLSNWIMDHATRLECDVDGAKLQGLSGYRADTPEFLFTVPEEGLRAPGTYGPAVADGYWVFLAPLSGGKHTVHLAGTLEFTKEADGFDFEFSLDITYHLTVGR